MKDEAFIRGAIPMTKSEVRAVSVSRLELKPGDVLYDVGAVPALYLWKRHFVFQEAGCMPSSRRRRAAA